MTMSAQSNGTINDLIQTCIDGQKAFEAAAKAVDDPMIKDELVGYSWQRQQFATELKTRMKAFGEEPSEHGSMSGALQRGLMDMKAAFTGGDGHTVLSACEKEEDSTVATYRDAMSSGLPAEYSELVQSQFQTIQRTHDRIKALRDATHKN
jgi:uncharacterized protein (TIGR02284 family)